MLLIFQDQPKALHKCLPDEASGERPIGICSAITVGSMLPIKLPLMRGSIIEILASRYVGENFGTLLVVVS